MCVPDYLDFITRNFRLRIPQNNPIYCIDLLNSWEQSRVFEFMAIDNEVMSNDSNLGL